MAQQDISKLSGNIFKRVLYSKSVIGLTPIASGMICGDATRYLGRIVEEYTPPTPNYKTAEIKMLGGVSKFHGSGISSYKIEIKVYFKSKPAYIEFLYYIKSELVYYDENGYIYNCSVMGEPTIERVEAGNKYLVKLTLQGVKKDSYYEEFETKFSDIANHRYEDDIIEVSSCGLVALLSENGYVYSYNPNAVTTRAEIVSFINRLRKYVKDFVK